MIPLPNNLYRLHYKYDEIGPNLEIIIAFIMERIDYSEPRALIEKREDARLLMTVASKCCLSADYYYRKVGSKSGEDYALMASLRDYTKQVRDDLATTIMTIGNSINYYKFDK